jgi:hypothetical protein
MIEYSFNPSFNIGDTVFHKTNPDNGKGVIVDIQYSVYFNDIKYLVSFGRYAEDEILMNELEMSKEKPIEF